MMGGWHDDRLACARCIFGRSILATPSYVPVVQGEYSLALYALPKPCADGLLLNGFPRPCADGLLLCLGPGFAALAFCVWAVAQSPYFAGPGFVLWALAGKCAVACGFVLWALASCHHQ